MTPTILILRPALWQATLQALAPYHRRRVEGGCLWYGARDDDIARAVAVGIPRQVNWARNFEIPADALADLSRRMPENLVVVGQIHCHPGSDTTHSPWDDAMIVSRRVFSLVLPYYAAPSCDLSVVGVHVHEGTRWVRLSAGAIRERLVVETASDNTSEPLVVDER